MVEVLISQKGMAWWGTPYRLVTLRELLMLDTHGEFFFGPFANLSYYLGRLDAGAPENAIQGAEIAGMLSVWHEWMEHFAFRVSAKCTQDIIDILQDSCTGKRTICISELHDRVTVLRQSFMTELESTLFIQVDYSNARYFREPRRDWEQVIERFGDTVSDVEEAGKCYALGRYAASVFHCMQVVEHGLLALGKFLSITDPKSGFTAVANELQRIKNKKYQDLNDFERTNLAFIEQLNACVQAMKDAWRNKVMHVQGRFVLMTADFSPQVAMEILMATRGFMRRLATDLP